LASAGFIQKDKYTIYAVAAHATTGTGQLSGALINGSTSVTPMVALRQAQPPVAAASAEVLRRGLPSMPKFGRDGCPHMW
jgi:hypothetical protein